MNVRWEHLLKPVKPVKRKIGPGTWFTREGNQVTVRDIGIPHFAVTVTPGITPGIHTCEDLAGFFAALSQQYRDEDTELFG